MDRFGVVPPHDGLLGRGNGDDLEGEQCAGTLDSSVSSQQGGVMSLSRSSVDRVR